jgi:hypothetical protein
MVQIVVRARSSSKASSAPLRVNVSNKKKATVIAKVNFGSNVSQTGKLIGLSFGVVQRKGRLLQEGSQL